MNTFHVLQGSSWSWRGDGGNWFGALHPVLQLLAATADWDGEAMCHVRASLGASSYQAAESLATLVLFAPWNCWAEGRHARKRCKLVLWIQTNYLCWKRFLFFSVSADVWKMFHTSIPSQKCIANVFMLFFFYCVIIRRWLMVFDTITCRTQLWLLVFLL